MKTRAATRRASSTRPAPSFQEDGAPEVERAWLPERYTEIPAALVLEYDALYLTQQRVTRASVARAAEGRLKVVARHGVGYDSVDVAAMTEAGVIVTNTPFAIRRPPVPEIPGRVWVWAAGAVLGLLLWHVAGEIGGDGLFHLARARKLLARASRSPRESHATTHRAAA